MARRAVLHALLVASALVTVPAAASASSYPDDVTLTPHNPLPTNSSYHVDACSLRKNTLHAVDTTGPGFFFTRDDYLSDAHGCVHYDAVTGSTAGQYGITVQQYKGGGDLAVVDAHVFTVQ